MARWLVTELASRALRIYLPEYVTADETAAAVAELVTRLNARAERSVVVAALQDVQGFDVSAPVIAAKTAFAARDKIAHVHIVTRRRIVGVASISAARVLGLSFSVHTD